MILNYTVAEGLFTWLPIFPRFLKSEWGTFSEKDFLEAGIDFIVAHFNNSRCLLFLFFFQVTWRTAYSTCCGLKKNILSSLTWGSELVIHRCLIACRDTPTIFANPPALINCSVFLPCFAITPLLFMNISKLHFLCQEGCFSRQKQFLSIFVKVCSKKTPTFAI